MRRVSACRELSVPTAEGFSPIPSVLVQGQLGVRGVRLTYGARHRCRRGLPLDGRQPPDDEQVATPQGSPSPWPNARAGSVGCPDLPRQRSRGASRPRGGGLCSRCAVRRPLLVPSAFTRGTTARGRAARSSDESLPRPGITARQSVGGEAGRALALPASLSTIIDRVRTVCAGPAVHFAHRRRKQTVGTQHLSLDRCSARSLSWTAVSVLPSPGHATDAYISRLHHAFARHVSIPR